MAFTGGATAQVTGIVTLKDQFTKGLRGMERGLDRMQRYGGKAVSNLDRNLGRLAVVGGAAAFFGVKEVVGAASDFQDAMARVEKTLSAPSKTPENLQRISDELIEISKTMPVTAVELAEIAKQAGQLGIEAADDITAFTETLAKLSRVTELDVGYAAENMGKLRTIFNMSASDLDHFGNVLIALENSAASTVQEILNITQRFGAAGKQAGLSADQIAAFASTIASLGVRPEAAGSSLSRLFNRVGVEIAKGSDKAKNFGKFMAIPFKELEKQFARDPAKFFVDFFAKVNKIFKEGSPVERNRFKAILESIGITNVRDVNAVLQLAQGYEELARQLGVAAGATNELDEAAKSRFASFASKLQIFQNKLNAAAIVIGNELLPPLSDAMDRIAAWVQEHGPDIQQFAKDLGKGFQNFVEQITPERMNAAVGIVKSIFEWTQRLVGAFMALPDWVKQILIGLYVGNKLTGGVVGDILGDVLGGGIKKILGIQAGVVNVTGGIVNAGLTGGAGGIGGAGAFSGILGKLSKMVLVAGSAAIIAEAFNVWQQQNAGVSRMAAEISQRTSDFIAQQPTTAALENALAGVRKGINDLQSNPLHVLVQGDALDKLRQMAAALNREIEQRKQPNPSVGNFDMNRQPTKNQPNPSIGNFVPAIKSVENAVKGNKQATKSGLDKVNRNVGRLARKPTKIGVANRTSVRAAIKMVVNGSTLAQAVYQSSASHKATLRENPSVGNFIT